MNFNEFQKMGAGSVRLPEYRNAQNVVKEESKEMPQYMEPEPSAINIDILQNNLGNCLNIIDDEVMKGYVTKLEQLPIEKSENYLNENLKEIHFFKISELVYQEDEVSVDKLAMVFHGLSNKPCTLVLMLKSNGEKTEFYLGARPKGGNSAGTLFQMLTQSLVGFFPGSKITEYYDEDMKKDMQSLSPGAISAVTCVADYKQEQENISNKEFIQGLEKFVYAMQGKSYTAIFIADDLSHNELMMRKREYEQIYTQISPFANMQMNFSVSDGSSISNSDSEGISRNRGYTRTTGQSSSEMDTQTHTTGTSESLGTVETNSTTNTESNAEGTSHTTGTTDGVNHTVTDGTTKGMYAGISSNSGIPIAGITIGAGKSAGVTASKSHSVSDGTSHTDSVSDSVSSTLTHGFSESKGHSDSRSYGYTAGTGESKSTGISRSESISEMNGESFNLVNTKTMTDTFGSSKGITLNAQNMTLSLVLQRLGKQLERLEECESLGMWNFAAYFMGESASETETAANTYKAVVAGINSGIERSAVNSWTEKEKVNELTEYIKNFVHPQFEYKGFSYGVPRYITVNPSALVSTKELAIHMGLPRHSVRGLPVVEHAAFGQEVITRKKNSNKKIQLGQVYNLGRETKTEVELDIESLSMHTLIAGSTGSGKSNTVYYLLSELKKNRIPFLVVEPAKGEYKNVFKDVRCFGTNPHLGDLLKINPFSFPKEVHILENIDRIVEIFNVCWPMYAAMPAVLKDSIERAYVSAGWELDASENTKIPGLFPTFDDVLRELNITISESAYSSDTKGDYIGSLSTRLKSLTNGINGRIFGSDELKMSELFDHNAIIDISRVGSMETKSLIMGLVVIKLQEYRMAKSKEMNMPLRHITVLEEAHNLLKKTSTEQSAESSNMIGKSVEMLTNTIAEIRTYGEGFMIVDQSPNLLDTAAIRNTNTKIILRLPENSDREVTGGSMALKEQQFEELSKLPTGVAAVYQNDWQEAVLCKIPRYQSFDYELYEEQDKQKDQIEIRKEKNDRILHLLLQKELSEEKRKELIPEILTSNVSAKIRKSLILNMEKRNRNYEWAVADFINKNYNFEDIFRGTAKCKNLEHLYKIIRQNIDEEFDTFEEEEMFSIVYYICRIEHEKHPENTTIELLRTNYLKEKVM